MGWVFPRSKHGLDSFLQLENNLLPCLPTGQDTEAEDVSGAADMDTGNGNPVDIATALGTDWADDLQAVVSGVITVRC